MSTNKLLLAIALAAGALIRLFFLGSHPIHMTSDEAALGYNAYSIITTARDEHGVFMPVIFKSFGDWKPGLYVYLSAPSIFLLGLNEFSVRLPSAISGILAIYFVYVLGKKLFNEKIGIFGALALSFMPWHIHFSRGAWEANLSLTLLLLGVYFLFTSFEKNKYLMLSSVFIALTFWAYQTAKISSLIPLVIVFVLYFKEIKSIKLPVLLMSSAVGILIILPVLSSIFNGQSGRLEVMSVFSYPRSEEYINSTILNQEDITKGDVVYTLFHSETFNLVRGVMGRYFNYLSGRFLFFEGDWQNSRHSSPGSGYLLFVYIPFLFIGMAYSFNKIVKKQHMLLLSWLALSPLPAALTRDSAHGVRSLHMAIPLALVIGIGLYAFMKYISFRAIHTKLISLALIAVVFIYSLFLYVDAYFIQAQYFNARDQQYGYKQMVQRIMDIGGGFDRIVVNQSYAQPYIYFLFFEKYDPSQYQKDTSYIESGGKDVGTVSKLRNIEFRNINWSGDIRLENTLLIGPPESFPADIEQYTDINIDRINYPNGDIAFYLVNK